MTYTSLTYIIFLVFWASGLGMVCKPRESNGAIIKEPRGIHLLIMEIDNEYENRPNYKLKVFQMDTQDTMEVNVVVTNEFEGDVKKYLTQIEFDALLLLLAVDPAAGSEHPVYREIQVLPWHANRLKILYTVLLAECNAEIVLLAIISAGELARAKDSAADSRVRTSLRQLRNVTAGIGVRELWVWIKNHFPDWFT